MKKFLTIAMITLAAMAAKADLYLYWTIDPAANDLGASYAELYAGEVSTGVATSIGYAIDTQISSSESYWVKLYDNAKNEIGYSTERVTFSEVQAVARIYEHAEQIKPSSSHYSFSGFTSTIPEPTSGLMLLIGLVGLALKRKVA